MLNELKLNCRVCALNINEIDCIFLSFGALLVIALINFKLNSYNTAMNVNEDLKSLIIFDFKKKRMNLNREQTEHLIYD